MNAAATHSPRILVLGAGLVTRPLVDYLLAVPSFQVTVASRTVSKAERMIAGHPRGKALPLDVENDAELDRLVGEADLVISLLPYVHHVKVAGMCIAQKRQMITTSYVSAEMRGLDTAAKDAGILILNEIGLDPGIDHMSAMKIIHEVEKGGGKIVSFTSNCGGLPAPEANTNPWGYKFSWSPRGVVLAARNSAQYLWNGEIRKIPGPELFGDQRHIEVPGLGRLEVYPNRDSLSYQEIYGLKDTRTLMRGTIRYPGHCATWKALADCGWLSLDERDLAGASYAAFFTGLLGATGDLKAALARFLHMDESADPIARMEWLGLLGGERVPGERKSPLDVLAERLLVKLPYAPGERDMIILQHRFGAEYPNGYKRTIVSTLVDYGQPRGDSSMSRTVSLPAAIAARMILQGEIRETGVHIPVIPGIYEPVLAELARLGIAFKETEEPA